jgi:putative tricarboxylic transport membrane protein
MGMEPGRDVKIRSQIDFWCGVIFVAIGVAFMLLAQEYRIGTAARMGPGYFPTLLGGFLAAIGLSLVVPALIRDGAPFPSLHLRPLLAVLVGIAVFAVLFQPLGFVLSLAALIVIASLADPDLRLVEIACLTVFLVTFAVLVFVLLLGLPFNLWPDL